MRFLAITQIILVGLSVVIIFTVIRPMFDTIRLNQDEIVKFRQAISTAGEFNTRLTQLRARADSFSARDLEALETYIPPTIDMLSVSRDIALIAQQNGMIINDITAHDVEGSGTEEMAPFDPSAPLPPELAGDPMLDPNAAVGATSLVDEAERKLVSQTFSVDVLGSYEQMKSLLADFERNVYPLRLVGLEFTNDSSDSSDAFVFSLELETYALTSTP